MTKKQPKDPKGLVVPVSKGKKGENVATVSNILVLPLAIIEILVTGTACALNYMLRYDTQIREDCSMVNWEGVKLLCSDINHISQPLYNETDPTTTGVTFQLPEWTFFTCAIVVPSCIVILVEVLKSLFSPRKVKVVLTAGMKLKPVYRRIPRYICTFMMGGALVGTLVSVLKLLIVSPRPHFLEVCTPNDTLDDSCDPDILWSPYTMCSGDSAEVHEALRAFPSYHAALAVYCGIWTVVYLSTAARLSGVYSPTLVMVGAISAMASIGASHHLLIGLSSSNDVIVGGIIGAIVALYVTLIILNGFKEKQFRVKVLHQRLSLEGTHPNMLPIVPLQGSSNQHQVHSEGSSMDSDDDEDSEGASEYNQLAIRSTTFPFIPRATSNRNISASGIPAQAVNSYVAKSPKSIPVPPPLPHHTSMLGPPPSYTRTETLASYNVPRQRFSAPVTPPRAPDYDGSRSNILSVYHSRDSDTLPRSRTETSSYF